MKRGKTLVKIHGSKEEGKTVQNPGVGPTIGKRAEKNNISRKAFQKSD